MADQSPIVRPGAAPAVAAPMAPARPMMALMDPVQFDQMQRVGRMLALSPLFPEHLRKGSEQERIANGVLVVNMALRLHEDPLTVGQNIYFVGGRPGWNTTYMISKANMHGVFKNPIDWDVSGQGDSLSVTAFAELSGTGKRVQMTADMELAKAEGWTRNTKYKSLPEVMLRYRSAASLIRMYCPEVMIGVPPVIELETEMRDATPRHAQTVVDQIDGPQDVDADPIEDAEEVAAEAPKPARRTRSATRKTDPAPDHTDKTPMDERPSRTTKAPDPEPEPEQAGMDLGGAQEEPEPSAPTQADTNRKIGETGMSLAELLRVTEDHMKADLDDGVDLDDVVEMYQGRLNTIKDEDAAAHSALLARVGAYAAELAG